MERRIFAHLGVNEMELAVCVHPESAASALMELLISPHSGTCVLLDLAVYELQRGLSEDAAAADGPDIFLEE